MCPYGFREQTTKDALVNSKAYVSAFVRNELDRIKQQAPGNTLKIDEPPNFQNQVANSWLEN